MKINNPLIRKLGASLVGLLLLIYVGYQVYLVHAQEITTETATYAEVKDTVQVSAWIIRNESMVHARYSGVPSFRVADGEKVSKDGVIADIYATAEDAAAQTQLKRLDEEISSLNALQGTEDYYTANPELIGTQIDETVIDVLHSVADNDFDEAASCKSRLQFLLNQKRIMIGKEDASNYQERLESLTAERNRLAASSAGRVDYITAPASGYFYSTTDGYENSFSYEDIEDLTVEDLENVQAGQIDPYACGKIERDFGWYLAAEITETDKIKLEKNNTVYLEMPFASTEQIPAQIVAMNKDNETGTYALILRSNYMNAELAGLRNETVEIVAGTYSGVLVNQKSIYFEDVVQTETDEEGNTREVVYENVKGVYVKFGERINFVQIFSDITINGYAVCKTELSEEEEAQLRTDSTISLYDEVVTGGTNLYDGKLL